MCVTGSARLILCLGGRISGRVIWILECSLAFGASPLCLFHVNLPLIPVAQLYSKDTVSLVMHITPLQRKSNLGYELFKVEATHCKVHYTYKKVGMCLYLRADCT